MQGRGGKEQIALRYYVVRIKRLGDILIKASSAEEAAKMAMQFDSDSWGNFKIHVEVVGNEANQDGKDIKIKGMKRKEKRRKAIILDGEIPF